MIHEVGNSKLHRISRYKIFSVCSCCCIIIGYMIFDSLKDLLSSFPFNPRILACTFCCPKQIYLFIFHSQSWLNSLFTETTFVNMQLNTFILNSVPVVVVALSFGIYTLFGRNLTPARAFTSLSLFAVLRLPLYYIATAITQVFSFRFCYKKILTTQDGNVDFTWLWILTYVQCNLMQNSFRFLECHYRYVQFLIVTGASQLSSFTGQTCHEFLSLYCFIIEFRVLLILVFVRTRNIEVLVLCLCYF